MIETAKAEQVNRVKKSLLSKCHDKVVEKERVLPNGKIIKYNDFIPADFNAQKFYLLNKASDEYKERQEVTVKKTEFVIDVIDDAQDVEYKEVDAKDV
jgi:hypothetical protein